MAPWYNLTLAKSVSMPGRYDDIFPACFPDINGQVYLRGHVTLSPVPAVGGHLLALFPIDEKGCHCTPLPDADRFDNNIIVTSTALAYPQDTPNKPDVCIVRLLISQFLVVDVNQDLKVDNDDIFAVESSPYYSFFIGGESTCPLINAQLVCGRADVNFDGAVDPLDTTAITQSVYLGTNVSCGGIYATAFSCGSKRTAPLTPAVDISFDSIVYFNEDGVDGTPTKAARSAGKRNLAAMDKTLFKTILHDFEHVQNELHSVSSELFALKGDVSTKLVAHDRKLMTHDSKLETHDSDLVTVKSSLVTHDGRLFTVNTKLMQHDNDIVVLSESKVRHDRVLRHIPAEKRDMVATLTAVVAGIVLCGAVVYVLVKRQ